MRTETKSVYYCEHCNKHGLSKSAMTKHERWCSKNPINHKACYGCKYSKEEPFKLDTGIMSDDEVLIMWTRKYKCLADGHFMFTIRAEKKGLPEKYPEVFKDQSRMPAVCSMRDVSTDTY